MSDAGHDHHQEGHGQRGVRAGGGHRLGGVADTVQAGGGVQT